MRIRRTPDQQQPERRVCRACERAILQVVPNDHGATLGPRFWGESLGTGGIRGPRKGAAAQTRSERRRIPGLNLAGAAISRPDPQWTNRTGVCATAHRLLRGSSQASAFNYVTPQMCAIRATSARVPTPRVPMWALLRAHPEVEIGFPAARGFGASLILASHTRVGLAGSAAPTTAEPPATSRLQAASKANEIGRSGSALVQPWTAER